MKYGKTILISGIPKNYYKGKESYDSQRKNGFWIEELFTCLSFKYVISIIKIIGKYMM